MSNGFAHPRTAGTYSKVFGRNQGKRLPSLGRQYA